MGNLDTLKIADHALELAVLTYSITDAFPGSERFGLSDQMRRASVSVGSNIAEGIGRWTNPQLLHSLEISCGSASELEFLAPSTLFRKQLPNPRTVQSRSKRQHRIDPRLPRPLPIREDCPGFQHPTPTTGITIRRPHSAA